VAMKKWKAIILKIWNLCKNCQSLW